jgi:hypothetical protein
MSVTQKQGIITCIPKEGKDKRFIKNWRPVTLLNTVYKIASSCIAERIKSVLPKLIHEDQKGFLKGRYIGENIRLIYHVLYYADLHNVPGLLLTLDFEKAFDSVAWSFIDKTLAKVNFGEGIRKWVSSFYSNITSCVCVNGQYSSWFKIERGTRQGDPLSCYLYLLCAEIMSIMLRKNADMKGISIGEIQVLLSQFADDTSIFLDGSRRSFFECIKVLNEFSRMSGLKINYEKSVAVWLGAMNNSREKFLNELSLIWNPETFKVLGVIFSLNVRNIVHLNYDDKLGQVEKILKSWSKRNLTPFGKVTVIKTLALSKLTYLFFNNI